jgi:hypothetical protein
MEKKVVRRRVKTVAEKATTPVRRTKAATAAKHDLPLREAIERRAYEIYQARGLNGGGNPESDWLQAERELQEQL